MATERSNTEHGKNERSVFAGVDNSALSRAVCDYAAWISEKVGAPLQLQHNIEHREVVASSDWSGFLGMGGQEKLLSELTEVEREHSKLKREEGKLLLGGAAEYLEQRGVTAQVGQRHGALAETVVDQEDEIRVLVLGIRGEDHEHAADELGSQVETIVRSLHRPILVVNREYSEPKRLMVAYNKSKAAQKALEWLVSSPLYQGMEVHLVHVADKAGNGTDSLLASAEQQLKACGLDVTVAKLDGSKGEMTQLLCDYQAANDIDLTVMGAFGHTRIHDLLIGSFTAKMLAATQKPMLLLR